jgi:hypothetical protein
VAHDERLARFEELDAESLSIRIRHERRFVTGADESEDRRDFELVVVEWPEFEAAPVSFSGRLYDEGTGSGGAALENFRRGMEAAAGPRESSVARRSVREANQPEHGLGRVSGQVLPCAIDPEKPELSAQPEYRLSGLLDELIEPAPENAGRRHEDDWST